MVILGIDPGTSKIGFGVIRKSTGGLEYVDSGLLNVPRNKSGPERLVSIEKEMERILRKNKPNRVGLEKVFFSLNKKTALEVSEARGVIKKLVAGHSIPIVELAPTEVKLAVTGDGKADKRAVAKLVAVSLNLKGRQTINKGWSDDVFDALAVAIASSNKISY